MWLISSIHDHSDASDFSRPLPSPAPKAMKIILWLFDSIQFVGAIVEYYPFTLWIHPICSGYWLALQTPTEWSGLEGNKLALPMQNSGTRGGSTYKMAEPRVKFLHKKVAKNHSVTALRPQI